MNPRIRTILGTAFLSIPLLAGCDAPTDTIQYRTSGLKSVASLDVYVDGKTVHLLLAGSRAGVNGPALRYTRSDDGGATWRTPTDVVTIHATPYPSHRGNDAQLAADGDRLVVVWQNPRFWVGRQWTLGRRVIQGRRQDLGAQPQPGR